MSKVRQSEHMTQPLQSGVFLCTGFLTLRDKGSSEERDGLSPGAGEMMEFQVGSPGSLHLAVLGRGSIIPLGISLDQASLEWGPPDTSKEDGWVSGREQGWEDLPAVDSGPWPAFLSCWCDEQPICPFVFCFSQD